VTKNAHTWFWVRTSPPRKPVWNRCVEFEIKTPEGVTETHFINGKTGIVTKVGRRWWKNYYSSLSALIIRSTMKRKLHASVCSWPRNHQTPSFEWIEVTKLFSLLLKGTCKQKGVPSIIDGVSENFSPENKLLKAKTEPKKFWSLL
jgi:hypothetical protein